MKKNPVLATSLALLLLLSLAVVSGWVIWIDRSSSESRSGRSSAATAILKKDHPNIILIYTDDIDCESLFSAWPDQSADAIRFPTLRRLAKSGTTFTNFHVTTPVCGPSRACMLSGQYAHSNQIRVNNPRNRNANGFSGGYREFNRDHELGRWMKQTGYSTAFVGKYLHDDFSPSEERNETWSSIMPKGWDRFFCSLGGRYFQFGQIVKGQDQLTQIKDQYRTDFESRLITRLIKDDLAESASPFFLCWAPYAAHMSTDLDQMSPPRHKDLFQDEVPQGILDFDIHNQIRNQPEELASIPSYITQSLNEWSKIHQKRLRTISALDEGLGQIIETLKNTGQLDNTLIVFTSDHGFSMGQHRHFGKRLPYDRITRVPFIVAGPGVPADETCDQLLANIDIAPTLIALAGGNRPASVDGISFAGLFRNPDLKIKREGIIIENWDRIWSNSVELEAAYCSYRTQHHLYTEWASGGFEFFDVKADPDQINNLYPGLDESKRQDLKRKLNDCRSAGSSTGPVFSRELAVPKSYLEQMIISANFDPVRFSGFVEAGQSIKGVELELYCEKIDRYWNGNSWSTEKLAVPAHVAMPGGHITRWSWNLDTRNIAFDRNQRMNRRDVVVNVIATDANDNQTRWESALSFKMKINDPQTWIDKPAAWVDKGKPLRITGIAADNFQLGRVEMLVVDLDRNLFWDDANKKWVSDRTLFDVDLDLSEQQDRPGHWGRWSFEFDGPQMGTIFFCPRAFDADGNFDCSVPYQIVPYEKASRP